MDVKTYTPLDPKFDFGKIECKVSHYIQHGFIRLRSGFSKDKASMLKCLAINYFIYVIVFITLIADIRKGSLIKDDNYFRFIKVDAANVLFR